MEDKTSSNFGAKQLSFNMISQIISFVINLAISFFLTPFIVEKLSEEAYGFVGLSSNFISYATLITTAVNSMAGRFIAVAYYKNKKEDVASYYSSVLVANVILCFLLGIPATFIILFLPNIINVPSNLLQDVTALFILVFSHFFIDLISNTFTNSGYVVNRLDMVAMRKTEATAIKGVLSFLIFMLLIPRLWYIGFIQVICSLYNFYRNHQIHRKLMPEIKIDLKKFDKRKIFELLSSGIWNTISSAGSVLISGLDLLIVNLTVSAAAMGIVSIAKQIPIYIQSLVVTLANVFAPKQTKLFAEEKFDEMKSNLIYSSKIVAMISAIPVVFILVYGKNFFLLWVPSQNAELLWIIASVAVITFPISLVCSPFSAIISAANKVRINSIVTLAFSGAGLGIMFVLLTFIQGETYKMLVVVFMSMGFMTLQSLCFLVPYCAKTIGCKTGGFYLVIAKSLLTVIISFGLCYLFSLIFTANGWITLILSGCAVCVICLAVSIVVVLNKQDRRTIFETLQKSVNKILKRK